MFRYVWGGLHVQSSFKLPDLMAESDAPRVDIDVSCGPMPVGRDDIVAVDARQGVGLQCYHFDRAGIAQYWVEGGQRILVEAVAGVSEATIAAYLLGRPFAALAYQRGNLSIHGGSIVTEQGVVVFAAEGGTGKSTLLAALDAAGHQLMSDDAALLRFEGERAMVFPTSCRYRLNPDALSCIAPYREALPVRENFTKRSLAFARPALAPMPMASIYLLERRGTEVHIETVRPIEALALIQENLNRPFLAHIIRGKAAILHDVARVVASVPVFRLIVPDDLSALAQVVAALRGHGVTPLKVAPQQAGASLA